MEWRTIDSAPKGPEEIDVLIYDQGQIHIAAYWSGTESWWVLSEFSVKSPSHWMPLPAPPSADPGIPVYRMQDATDDVLGRDGE